MTTTTAIVILVRRRILKKHSLGTHPSSHPPPVPRLRMIAGKERFKQNGHSIYVI
jgi:hypothetical protein